MLGLGENLGDGLTSKQKFMGLTSELEQFIPVDIEGCNCDRLVDVAVELRNMLRVEGVSLSRREKIKVLKMLNKAKVRSFMMGTTHSIGVFRTLDSISSDVVELL